MAATNVQDYQQLRTTGIFDTIELSIPYATRAAVLETEHARDIIIRAGFRELNLDLSNVYARVMPGLTPNMGGAYAIPSYPSFHFSELETTNRAQRSESHAKSYQDRKQKLKQVNPQPSSKLPSSSHQQLVPPSSIPPNA